MSNLFIVSDDVINPKNQNRTIKLNNNLLEGFKTSAENGQIRLALQYMIHMFNIINDNLNGNNHVSQQIVLTSEAEVTPALIEANTNDSQPSVSKKTKKQEVLEDSDSAE